jgi:hypothetical protein
VPTATAALGTATVFAALIAIPASLRVGDGANAALVWLALAGSSALVCGTLAAAVESLRRNSHGLKTIGLATVLALPLLSVFGAVLKTATHHRALGGVTFAVVGAFVLITMLIGANRAWRWADSSGKSRLLMVVGAIGLLAGLRVCLPLVSHPGSRMAVADGVLLVVGAVVASVWVPHSSLQNRTLARALWGGASAMALVVLLASAPTLKGAREAAPVLFGPFWLLSR